MNNTFEKITGQIVPLDRANVDTDAIMPKQFLKSIKKTGYGDCLFDSWRYIDKGEPGIDCSTRSVNKDFILNQDKYSDATILLTQENFGCGSSREHAVWGLLEYGFKAILAPSFAEIFANNCVKNNLLLITLEQKIIDQLFSAVTKTDNYKIQLDLSCQKIFLPNNESIQFTIDLAIKNRLERGLDDIAITLEYKDQILNYEKNRKKIFPWLF